MRVLSRKNNDPTLSILFRAMTVITSASDRPNVSLVHVWKSTKKWPSFAENKIQLCLSTYATPTLQLGWTSLKLSGESTLPQAPLFESLSRNRINSVGSPFFRDRVLRFNENMPQTWGQWLWSRVDQTDQTSVWYTFERASKSGLLS